MKRGLNDDQMAQNPLWRPKSKIWIISLYDVLVKFYQRRNVGLTFVLVSLDKATPCAPVSLNVGLTFVLVSLDKATPCAPVSLSEAHWVVLEVRSERYKDHLLKNFIKN